jgi:hypothetical protein
LVQETEMDANNRYRRHIAICGLCLFSFFLAAPSVVSAQSDTQPPPFVWSVAKSVLLDPTTYAPAALSYSALHMDWNSSQALFRAGYVEQNHLFTVSGRPNDIPIGYGAGNKKIRRMALVHLEESLANNIAANVFERVLAEKYPRHRKLFKTLSWVERIAFSSYVSYLASANHFKQARLNQDIARQNGYR